MFLFHLPMDACAANRQGEKLYKSLIKMFPDEESIIRRYGSGAKRRKIILTSIHDHNYKLVQENFVYPGIEFRVVRDYNKEEVPFYLLLVDVKRANLLNFLGVDIGSTKDAMIKTFGRPDEVKKNVFEYYWEDSAPSYYPLGMWEFEIGGNKVVSR